ncbi:MAG TPA: hypothetical protein VKB76_10810, partial [Ktedonobacterales bacterium]|nr:hypothetical protein [Ktedonobacterales bacterium]
MPIRPEAQRRLQEGFQARIQKQQSKYEPQQRQATALAAEYHLGELEGIFAVKQQSAREMLSGMFFIAVLVCAIFGLPGVGMTVRGHPSAQAIAGSIVFLILLFVGFPLSLTLWRRATRYLWLYAFSDGLALGSLQSIERNITRWNQVTEVRNVWTGVYNPVSEDSEPRFTEYKLHLNDGRDVVISRAFQNMLDPYAPVGRMISAMVPTSVGKEIPSFPVI